MPKLTEIVSFHVPATVAEGDATMTLRFGEKWVQVSGTFDATIQLQGSINGTDWFDEGAPLTAAPSEPFQVQPRYKLMRVKTTVFTSGQPVVKMSAVGERAMTA